MPDTEDYSEASIKQNCPHCNIKSHAFDYPLKLNYKDTFHIVCDANSIVEGHILVIPNDHLSCIGEFDESTIEKFLLIHEKVTNFLSSTYGSYAYFEHGIYGQTVFHSHIHYLPFGGKPEDIIPEGSGMIKPIADIIELKNRLLHDGGYLFFGINEKMWTVDPKLSEPRFFRDRFAKALGFPERGNWKKMRQNTELMQLVKTANQTIQENWKNFT